MSYTLTNAFAQRMVDKAMRLTKESYVIRSFLLEVKLEEEMVNYLHWRGGSTRMFIEGMMNALPAKIAKPIEPSAIVDVLEVARAAMHDGDDPDRGIINGRKVSHHIHT